MTVSNTTNSKTSRTITTLAQKYRTNRYGIALKSFTGLLMICGIILSVLASLTCQYLNYHNDSSNRLLQDRLTQVPQEIIENVTAAPTTANNPLPIDGVNEAWLGLFSYEVVEFQDPTLNVTESCTLYDDHLFQAWDSPYLLFSISQLCAVVAPGLAVISMLVFFFQMALSRGCCNSYAISATLFLTSLAQAGTFAVYFDPQLCPDNSCELDYGAWISAASAGTFFLSSIVMGCTPLLDCWVDRTLRQTVGQPLKNSKIVAKSNDSLGSNSIVTDPSSTADADVEEGQAAGKKRDGALTASLRKAQSVWGSVFDIEKDNTQKEDPKKVEQEMDEMLVGMARSSTAILQKDGCNGCTDVAGEVTDDIKQVFGLSKKKAASPPRNTTSPSQTTQKRSPQYTETAPPPPRSLLGDTTVGEPSMSLHTSSSFNTSYFDDTRNMSLDMSNASAAPPPMVAKNPLIARMYKDLKQGPKKDKVSHLNRPAPDDKEDVEEDWAFFGGFFGN